jgi:dihydrofolate reductase
VGEALFADAGACLVGRRMFDVSEAWRGNPPGGLPCFVVTHEPPAEWIKAGSPFTFVTEGPGNALAQARAVAGDKQVYIGGGADIANQLLRAGLIDEIRINLVPVLLGAGTRLFERLASEPIALDAAGVIESPFATHLRFRVRKERA